MTAEGLDRSLPVFVTGATGYIGGRLVPRLLDAGHRVRCLVREPRKLGRRHWIDDPRVEIVRGDAGAAGELADAMRGCGAAYYLIHSMMVAGPDYRARDRDLAETFAAAAEAAGIARIVYLGGLGELGDGLSEHLASRREVERALASRAVPVTVFRAAMIIGSGSASFEILRYLVERLPVMITPRWVQVEAQPIAVADALHFLVACLDGADTVGRTLDIGGRDVMTYRRIMQEMAAALGLRRRLILPVPVLTPRLSSLWIHLVTPADRHIARPLAEGLRNRVVCRDDAAVRLMPRRLLGIRESIDAALSHLDAGEAETSWLDAGPIPGDPAYAGGTVYTDRRETLVEADASTLYRAVCRIGGRQGWHSPAWLWRLRGFADRLLGGPGLSRGRPHPDSIRFGDVLDFWRVADVVPDRRLKLAAEMKLPGRATLSFSIEAPAGRPRRCRLVQTARFRPRGLAGLAYWSVVKPFHHLVFSRMLEGLRRQAERDFRSPRPGPSPVEASGARDVSAGARPANADEA